MQLPHFQWFHPPLSVRVVPSSEHTTSPTKLKAAAVIAKRVTWLAAWRPARRCALPVSSAARATLPPVRRRKLALQPWFKCHRHSSGVIKRSLACWSLVRAEANRSYLSTAPCVNSKVVIRRPALSVLVRKCTNISAFCSLLGPRKMTNESPATVARWE